MSEFKRRKICALDRGKQGTPNPSHEILRNHTKSPNKQSWNLVLQVLFLNQSVNTLWIWTFSWSSSILENWTQLTWDKILFWVHHSGTPPPSHHSKSKKIHKLSGLHLCCLNQCLWKSIPKALLMAHHFKWNFDLKSLMPWTLTPYLLVDLVRWWLYAKCLSGPNTRTSIHGPPW